MPRLARSVILLGASLLWACVCSAAAERRPSLNVAALQRQPQVLKRALVALQPTQSDRAQLYFVGFAGYGLRRVFKREVLAVRKLFDKRFV
jgi:hypothetical protein